MIAIEYIYDTFITVKAATVAFAIVFGVGLLIPAGANAQLFGGMIKTGRFVIPANITLVQNQIYFVTSVYDKNYLPFSVPTTPATADTNVNPDGIDEATLIDAQGSISTTGVSVHIRVEIGRAHV